MASLFRFCSSAETELVKGFPELRGVFPTPLGPSFYPGLLAEADCKTLKTSLSNHTYPTIAFLPIPPSSLPANFGASRLGLTELRANLLAQGAATPPQSSHWSLRWRGRANPTLFTNEETRQSPPPGTGQWLWPGGGPRLLAAARFHCRGPSGFSDASAASYLRPSAPGRGCGRAIGSRGRCKLPVGHQLPTWPRALPFAFPRHLWSPHLWPLEPPSRVGHASKSHFVHVLPARTGGLGG